MNKIVVAGHAGGLISVLYENDTPVEINVNKDPSVPGAGDIILCRVKNIAENIHAAFCEMSGGQTGFLPLSEYDGDLKGGMLIPLQIKREGSSLKGPMLTGEFSIAGRYLVLLYRPKGSRMMISSRSSDRNAAADILSSLREAVPDPAFGFILRTKADGAPPECIVSEALLLKDMVYGILKDAEVRTAGSVLFSGSDIINEWLLRAKDDEECRLISDDRGIIDHYTASPLFSGPAISAEYYTDQYPLYKLYRTEHLLDIASSRRVWLKSGGFLIIDRTEAMTVIDINTGSNESGSDKESTVLQTNLEAADEIAYQLRLRNLSGIIIADLINMKKKENAAAVKERLSSALFRDPVKARLIDITGLGLAEITRAKKRKPLADQL